ncbi:hypothetical protein ACFX2A_013973 [Malus domestica]
MALPGLKAQIKILVQSMLHEGMLDYQFTQLQELQDSNNPNFVAEIIKLFCDNTEQVITELEKYLCEDVDFCKLTPFVLQLHGSSSSIGARQMTLACADLRQASDDKNKEGCLHALRRITHYYIELDHKFQTLIQLEKRILDIETVHQRI